MQIQKRKRKKSKAEKMEDIMIFDFSIEGKPQGKARAQTVKNKYTGKTHSYTPAKTENYESLIRWQYKATGGQYMGENLIAVQILAVYPIPKGWSKKKRQDALDGAIKPTTKPDCDNIIKVVLDALNGVAYYDDKQVINVGCQKIYGENGFVRVIIGTI